MVFCIGQRNLLSATSFFYILFFMTFGYAQSKSENSLILGSETKRLESTEVLSLPQSSQTMGSLVLPISTVAKLNLQPGNILISDLNRGYIARILRIQNEASQVTLFMEPASLEDAIDSGEASLSFDLLDPSMYRLEPPINEGVFTREVAQDDLKNRPIPGDLVNISKDLQLADGTVFRISGTIQTLINPRLYLRFKSFNLEEFNFQAQGSLRVNLNASSITTQFINPCRKSNGMQNECELTAYRSFVVFVEGLPILVRPSIVVGVDTSISGQLVGNINSYIETGATVGLQWTPVSGWQGNSYTLPIKLQPPQASLTASVNAGGKIYAKLILDLYFGALLGPSFDTEAFVRILANATNSNSIWSFQSGIAGNVGVKVGLPILSKKMLSSPKSELFSLVLWQCNGPPPVCK